jgi:hypothetical protein
MADTLAAPIVQSLVGSGDSTHFWRSVVNIAAISGHADIITSRNRNPRVLQVGTMLVSAFSTHDLVDPESGHRVQWRTTEIGVTDQRDADPDLEPLYGVDAPRTRLLMAQVNVTPSAPDSSMFVSFYGSSTTPSFTQFGRSSPKWEPLSSVPIDIARPGDVVLPAESVPSQYLEGPYRVYSAVLRSVVAAAAPEALSSTA